MPFLVSILKKSKIKIRIVEIQILVKSIQLKKCISVVKNCTCFILKVHNFRLCQLQKLNKIENIFLKGK